MKVLSLVACFFLFSSIAIAQNAASPEESLLSVFQQIKDHRVEDDVPEDSVAEANTRFEQSLISLLKQKPELIHYPFTKLQQARLRILTSKDKKLRVYNWDDNLGGTMRNFRTVVQLGYAPGKQAVFPLASQGAIVNELYTVARKSGGTYYLFSQTSILSTALKGELLEIYTVNKHGQFVEAPVIKTNARFSSQLSCEVDYSASVNRNTMRISTKAVYDAARQEISIPLIQEDGKITTRSIRYRFNGTLFEKIN